MKEAPSRKFFWFIYLGLAFSLYSQKEARGLAMEARAVSNGGIQSEESGGNSQGTTPLRIMCATWDKRPGDHPSHYEFQSTSNLTDYENLPFNPEDVYVEDDRYVLPVGYPSELGSRFFIRSVHDEE